MNVQKSYSVFIYFVLINRYIPWVIAVGDYSRNTAKFLRKLVKIQIVIQYKGAIQIKHTGSEIHSEI